MKIITYKNNKLYFAKIEKYCILIYEYDFSSAKNSLITTYTRTNEFYGHFGIYDCCIRIIENQFVYNKKIFFIEKNTLLILDKKLKKIKTSIRNVYGIDSDENYILIFGEDKIIVYDISDSYLEICFEYKNKNIEIFNAYIKDKKVYLVIENAIFIIDLIQNSVRKINVKGVFELFKTNSYFFISKEDYTILCDSNLEEIKKFNFSVLNKIIESENKLYFFKKNQCDIFIEKDFGYYDLNENKTVILDKKVNFNDFYIVEGDIIYGYDDYLKIDNKIIKLPSSKLCQLYTYFNNVKEKICKHIASKFQNLF
jgi:hypothetical protein